MGDEFLDIFERKIRVLRGEESEVAGKEFLRVPEYAIKREFASGMVVYPFCMHISLVKP
jgi:hypothetical protein